MNIPNIFLAPRNRCRVNLNNSLEVRYWVHTLNIAEAELKRIVRNVGTSVFMVEEELKHVSRNMIKPAA